MTKLFSSTRFFYLTLILIIFMLTAFPAAAFADDNEGSAENGQDTENAGSASETPQVQDYSPPASEAPASDDFMPPDSPQTDSPQVDSPQDLSAPSDSDLSGAADTKPVYFQVEQVSMSPLLPPGSIIEIVSDNYSEGDLVVAQKADGTYVVKVMDGAMLVPLGTGVSYNVSDLTILGKAALSPLTAADIEASGLAWSIVLGALGIIPTAGNGSLDNPYEIATLPNLYWIAEDVNRWSLNYEQTANIDASSTNSGAGWSPIGTNNNPFTGTYNGQDREISGLFINRGDADYIGLFGCTEGATLTNIALVDIDVTGDKCVGGLVGWSIESTISNSYTTGSVSGGNGVGGLIGADEGSIISNSHATADIKGVTGVGGLVGGAEGSTISGSHATGAVKGVTGVGGLVGGAENSTISNCYATGKVEGEGSGEDVSAGYGVGGLIGGADNCTISNSNATGDVHGISYVGGLIGGAESSTLSYCYATGDVQGNSYVGGLVGVAQNSTISNCKAEGDVEGSGEAEDGYGVGGLVGVSAKSTISDSSATGIVQGNRGVGGLVGVEMSELAFGTIYRSYSTGTVTGQSYVGGLVGVLHGSSIYESYSTSKVEGSGNGIGGLVGVSNLSTIYDSYATGDVIGRDYVGGLVGIETSEESSATIYRSYATGTVTGQSYVGGLVGMLSGSSIYKSFAAGSVNGTSNVGRLVGSNDGSTITNSFAVLQGSYPIVGSGSAEGADDTTIAAMKKSQTYLATSWNIVGIGGAYPLLGWQVGASSTWFMPGSHSDRGHFQDFGSITLTLPLQSSSVALTRIPRQDANAIITTVFVTGGSAADLNRAIAAYNQAQQSYETNKGTLSAAEKAVAEVELAIANAAIKALELSLAAQGGQAFDIAALLSAYNNAVAVLDANRALLTAEQIVEAEALLRAIATVISRYST